LASVNSLGQQKFGFFGDGFPAGISLNIGGAEKLK
jgi:hypothetical protein